jgi:DNA mismatch repair protein MutS2
VGESPEVAEPLAVGAWVRAPGGWQGRIVSLDEDAGRASVQTGELRLSVPLADLAVASEKRPPRRDTDILEPAANVVRPAPRAIPTSLDVRGARVEEALTMLEGYLDQAAVNGAPRLTIVHGFGSGALRDALRAALTNHPLVKKWRPGERGEGGDGATIVEF